MKSALVALGLLFATAPALAQSKNCLLYTSDAADEL